MAGNADRTMSETSLLSLGFMSEHADNEGLEDFPRRPAFLGHDSLNLQSEDSEEGEGSVGRIGDLGGSLDTWFDRLQAKHYSRTARDVAFREVDHGFLDRFEAAKEAAQAAQAEAAGASGEACDAQAKGTHALGSSFPNGDQSTMDPAGHSNFDQLRVSMGTSFGGGQSSNHMPGHSNLDQLRFSMESAAAVPEEVGPPAASFEEPARGAAAASAGFLA